MLSAMKDVAKRLFFRPGVRVRRVRGGALAGRRFYLDLRQDTQVWRGVYEVSVQQWLSDVTVGDAVCVDVGAAEGWVTLQMAILASRGRVVAFEPSERGDWIERNLALNDDLPLAETTIVRRGVGSVASASVGGGAQTPLVTLDGYVANEGLPTVSVLKIDVDGPELDVLDGAQETIRTHRPAVCVEAHSHELLAGVRERLEGHGYSIAVVDPPPHEHRPVGYNPMVFGSP